jgi:hypothetical protein
VTETVQNVQTIETIEAVEAPVAQQQTDSPPGRGDWFIAGAMLVFFGFGFALAEQWPHRAALFPQMVSAAGVVFVALKLVSLARRTIRARGAALHDQAAGHAVPPVAGLVAEECLDEDDNVSIEYVFATAGGRSWAAALAWVAAFFVSFFALGAFVSVPLFALVYLRFAGKASWLGAAAYAAVTGALIYVVFAKVVYTALPPGIIPLLLP